MPPLAFFTIERAPAFAGAAPQGAEWFHETDFMKEDREAPNLRVTIRPNRFLRSVDRTCRKDYGAQSNFSFCSHRRPRLLVLGSFDPLLRSSGKARSGVWSGL